MSAPLPQWTIGDKTGTLFRDGNPTGTEFKVFNRMGGTPEQLVAQANLAREMAQTLGHVRQTFLNSQDHPMAATHLRAIDALLVRAKEAA